MEVIERIKEVPRLPINNLFISAQHIGSRDTVVFDKKYSITFRGYQPKTAREKALFVSIYYALIYYAVKDRDKILLTDLMDNIGYPKKIGHGYLERQKEEVLEIVWNVAKSEIGASGPVIPNNIKKLFQDVEKKDMFKMNIFGINVIKQYSPNKRLKDAVIIFKPNFDTKLIRFNKTSEVLALPISEPEYKNLAIYIVYGSHLGERITKTVKEILEIAKIDIDAIHPERTFNKLVFALRKTRVDGYIERWEWDPFPDIRDVKEGKYRGGRGWFTKWLDSKIIIILPNKK